MYQLDSLSHRKMLCNICIEENWSSFTVPNGGNWQKKKNHHCKINTFIALLRIYKDLETFSEYLGIVLLDWIAQVIVFVLVSKCIGFAK